MPCRNRAYNVTFALDLYCYANSRSSSIVSSKPVSLKKLLPFYGSYTGQPVLAGTPSSEPEDFVGAIFNFLHEFADGS